MTRRRSIARATALVAILMAGQIMVGMPVKADVTVTLDGTQLGDSFQGLGAYTVAGYQRLLYDYPVTQRDQILDYLFKPVVGTGGARQKAGAAFQTMKVEIPSDTNVADGSESTYGGRAAFDSTCYYRGYQWWLMKEAKTRNSNMTFEALAEGTPQWVTGGVGTSLYTQATNNDGTTFVTKFLDCAHNASLDISYVGIMNEDESWANPDGTGLCGSGSPPNWNTPPNGHCGPSSQLDFVKALNTAIANDPNLTIRPQIVCCDFPFDFDPHRKKMDPALQGNDPALLNAVGVLGGHYLWYGSPDAAGDKAFRALTGRSLWSSEESSSVPMAYGDGGHLYSPAQAATDTRHIGDWFGAQTIARILNDNYIADGVQRNDVLFYLNGFYDTEYAPGSGFITATWPWTGHYEVLPALWAMAHWTHFTQGSGWKYIVNGSGFLQGTTPYQGTYVSLSNGTDWSIIAETARATGPQVLSVTLRGGLTTTNINYWSSSSAAQFAGPTSVCTSCSTFSLTLQPDSIYTISSVQDAGPLDPSTVPDPAPISSSYSDNFDSYSVSEAPPVADQTARDVPDYILPQEGAFEVQTSGNCGHQGQCLQQMDQAIHDDWGGGVVGTPYAIVGDRSWTNYSVSADVAFVSAPAATAQTLGLLARVQPGVDEGLDFGRRGGYELRLSQETTGGASPAISLVRTWTELSPSGANSACGATSSANIRYCSKVLASVTLPGSLGTSWHTLKFTVRGTTLKGTLDGAASPQVKFLDNSVGSEPQDAALLNGMTGLASGWNLARYDNLSVNQLTNGSTQLTVDDHCQTGCPYPNTTNNVLAFSSFASGHWLECYPCSSTAYDYGTGQTGSNLLNDYVSYNFYGTRAVLFGTTAPNGGWGCVSVASSASGTPNLSNMGTGATCSSAAGETKLNFYDGPPGQGNQVMYVTPFLTEGWHTVRVRVAGSGDPGQISYGAPGMNYIQIDRMDSIDVDAGS